MTGLVFATFAKFVEIGKIVNKVPGDLHSPSELHPKSKPQPPTRAEAGEELERRGLVVNKRNRKMLEREFLLGTETEKQVVDRGPVKHYSQVQFKPIYWTDMTQFCNLVLRDIMVPSFWHLEHEESGRKLVPKHQLPPNEIEHKLRMSAHVV